MTRKRWIVVLIVIAAAALLAPPLFMTGWMWSQGGSTSFFPLLRTPHMAGYFPAWGWLGMGLRALLPLTVVGLAAWGLVSLFTGSRRAAPARSCSACGRAAQADWSTCPYCGKPLS